MAAKAKAEHDDLQRRLRESTTSAAQLKKEKATLEKKVARLSEEQAPQGKRSSGSI